MAKPIEKNYSFLVGRYKHRFLIFYHRNNKFAPYEAYSGTPKFDAHLYPLKYFRTSVNE